MRKVLSFYLLLISSVTAAFATDTTITDTVSSPITHHTLSGQLTITPSAPFISDDGRYIAKQPVTVPIIRGAFSVQLAVNATPGSYYRVLYSLSDGTQYQESWVVPASSSALKIAQVVALQTNPVVGIVKITSDGKAVAATLSDITSLGLGSIVTMGMNAYDLAGAATSAGNQAIASSLQKQANLSDLANIPEARTALGIKDAALHYASEFDAAGAAAAVASSINVTGLLAKADNLAGLQNPAIARSNLGEGDISTHAFADVDPAGAAQQALASARASSLQVGLNLADLSDTAAGRLHLGLGDISTHAFTDVDPAGAATTAQAAAQAAGLSKSANLGDLLDVPAARNNLGVKDAALHPASDFEPAGAAAAAVVTASAQALQKSLNLADLTNPPAARSALGLDTAATKPIAFFDPAGAAAQAASLSFQITNNLSEVSSPALARQHLGILDAALHPASDFDPAGAAQTAQAGAQAASDPLGAAATAQAAAIAASDPLGSATTAKNLAIAASDPAGTAQTLITGLALKSASQHVAADFDPAGAADAARIAAIGASDPLGTATTAISALNLNSASRQPSTAFEPAGAVAAGIATVTGSSLQKTANLGDVSDAAAARLHIGLGDVATHAFADVDPAGAANVAQANAQASSLQKSANLSDVSDAAAARSNLHMGDIVTHAAAEFDPVGAAAQSLASATGSSLQKNANLTDVANVVSARNALGLGTIAVKNIADFDSIGAATTAQAAAIAASAQKSANLNDLANKAAAVTNLGFVNPASMDFTNANNLGSGTVNASRLPSTAVQTNRDAIFNGGTYFDVSSVLHTKPASVGTTAGKPVACTVGDVYFATDAAPGLNFFYCTATNTWIGQAAAIAGSGTGLVPSNNLADLTSVPVALSNLGIKSAGLQPVTAFLQPSLNFSDVADKTQAKINLGIPASFVDTTIADNIISGTLSYLRLPAMIGDVTRAQGSNTSIVQQVAGASAASVASAATAWAGANTANNALKLDATTLIPVSLLPAFSGDVGKPATSGITTILTVGGQSASNIAQVSAAWQAPNTASGPLKLDAAGHVPYAQLPAVTGDVSSLAGGGTTTVNLVGGQSASSVAAAAVAWAGANTANNAVKLDAGALVPQAQIPLIAATKLGNGDVSSTQLSYLNSLTANVQTQLNGKDPAGAAAAVGTTAANASNLTSGTVAYARLPAMGGDVTGTVGSSVVSRINGTTVAASVAADTVLITSASGASFWLNVPSCNSTVSALQFGLHQFGCKTLATVANSGSYPDLLNRPTLGAAAALGISGSGTLLPTLSGALIAGHGLLSDASGNLIDSGYVPLTLPSGNGIMKYTGSSATAPAVIGDITTITGKGVAAATAFGLPTVAGSGLSTDLVDTSSLIRTTTVPGTDLGGTFASPSVLKIHGTSVANSTAADSILLTTAPNVSTWALFTDCHGANQAVTYSVTTHALGCATISGGATVPSGTAGVTYTSGAGSITSVKPLSGNGANILTGTGPLTAAHTVVADATGNLVDAGHTAVASSTDLSDTSTLVRNTRLSGTQTDQILSVAGTLTSGHGIVISSSGDGIDTGAVPLLPGTACGSGQHISSFSVTTGLPQCTPDVAGSGGAVAGTSGAIQSNQSGVLSGDASNFAYNNTTHQATATGGFAAAGPTAGFLQVLQGSVPSSFPANSFTLLAPTTIATPYHWFIPGADGNGILSVKSDIISILGMQGTDTNILTAGTINGVIGSSLCLDAGGGATTVNCVSGGTTSAPSAGMVKSTGSALATAVGGTDYEFPLTFNGQASRVGNTVTVAAATGTLPAAGPQGSTLTSNGTGFVNGSGETLAAAVGIACDGVTDDTAALNATYGGSAMKTIRLPSFSKCVVNYFTPSNNVTYICDRCSLIVAASNHTGGMMYIQGRHDFGLIGLTFDANGVNAGSLTDGGNPNAETQVLVTHGGSGLTRNTSLPIDSNNTGGCGTNILGYVTTDANGNVTGAHVTYPGRGCTSLPTMHLTGDVGGGGLPAGYVAPTFTWDASAAIQASGSTDMGLIYQCTNIVLRDLTFRSTGATPGNLAGDRDGLTLSSSTGTADNLHFESTLSGQHLDLNAGNNAAYRMIVHNLISDGANGYGVRLEGGPSGMEVHGGSITNVTDRQALTGQNGNAVSINNSSGNIVEGLTIINTDFSLVRIFGTSSFQNQVYNIHGSGNKEVGVWTELGAENNSVHDVEISNCYAGLSDTNVTNRPHQQKNFFSNIKISNCKTVGMHVEHAAVRGSYVENTPVGYEVGYGGTGFGNSIRSSGCNNGGQQSYSGGLTYAPSTMAVCFGVDRFAQKPSVISGNDTPDGIAAASNIAYLEYSIAFQITNISQASPAIITYDPTSHGAATPQTGVVYLLMGIYGLIDSNGVSPNGKLCAATAVNSTAHTITCGSEGSIPALVTTGASPFLGVTPGESAPTMLELYSDGSKTPYWATNTNVSVTNAFQ